MSTILSGAVADLIRRTLTEKQRALLEEYAADVEKRPSAKKESKDEPIEPLNNGKVFFKRKPESFGAWLTEGWDLVRTRLGL